jgi:hypothetical protein
VRERIEVKKISKKNKNKEEDMKGNTTLLMKEKGE